MNELLRSAYLDALNEQLELRWNRNNPSGDVNDLTKTKNRLTPFDHEIADCIFKAGQLALSDRERGLAQYRVVSAPTGSGKSSFAQAFIKAHITTDPKASVLYLVETIDHAEDVFQDMYDLLGNGNVAVWTTAHNLNNDTPDQLLAKHGFIPTHRFELNELINYPVVIATHRFYSGVRAHKAVIHNGADRQLIFVDEKAKDVTLYDIDTGFIKTVRDALAEHSSAYSEEVTQLTALHNGLESIWQTAENKLPYDILSSKGLSWFLSEGAKKYLNSPDERVSSVFGFGKALAQGFAFLSRYDRNGKGARFIGYELTMPLRPGTVLLDATAAIDGVSLITNDRKLVASPQIDFRNLSVTHIEPPIPHKARMNQIVKDASKARPYATWVWDTVLENTDVGERVLVVVHNDLLGLDFLPRIETGFNISVEPIEGRHIRFINWGCGIGSNRWKDADAVFLFGEFHLPKRAIVGTALALKGQRADRPALKPFQSPKSQAIEFLALRDGHLCRHQKQMAMRGNARNIDGNGVSGVQRQYLTGEFNRLIRYADVLFPGASIVVDEPEKRLHRGGKDALVALLYGCPNQVITTSDVRDLTGIDLRKNKSWYLESVEVVEAMKKRNWSFQAGKSGRGNAGRFVRTPAIAA